KRKASGMSKEEAMKDAGTWELMQDLKKGGSAPYKAAKRDRSPDRGGDLGGPSRQYQGRRPQTARMEANGMYSEACIVCEPAHVLTAAHADGESLHFAFAGLLNEHPARVLCDTGATHSFVSASFVAAHAVPVHMLKHMQEWHAANNTVLSCSQFVKVDLSLPGVTVPCKLNVMPSLLPDFNVLLGNDWLNEHEAVMSYQDKTLSLACDKGEPVVLPCPPADKSESGQSAVSNPASFLVNALRAKPPLASAKVAARWLRKGGTGVLALITVDNSSTPDPAPTEPDLPPGVSQALNALLDEYADVFAPITSLPPERPVGHAIPLVPDARPFVVPQYRMSQEEHAELKKQVQDLLAKGMIEPSSSPFAAPILFVKKKSGELRMCLDYRQLNKEWRCYLEGVPFTLFTDHKPLTALPTQKVLSRRQARWMEFLSRFTFDLQYLIGDANPADPLSRIPAGPQDCAMVCVVTTRRQAKQSLERGEVRVAQALSQVPPVGTPSNAPTAVDALAPRPTVSDNPVAAHHSTLTINKADARPSPAQPSPAQPSPAQPSPPLPPPPPPPSSPYHKKQVHGAQEQPGAAAMEALPGRLPELEAPSAADTSVHYPAAPAHPLELADHLVHGYRLDPAFTAEADLSGMYMDDHGLWRRTGKGTVMVPNDPELREYILHEMHDAAYAGHVGITKTLERLSRVFYWDTMRADVRHYVTTCDACQRDKTSTLKPGGLLNPLSIPDYRWESVSMDLITKLPSASHGFDAICVFVDRLIKMVHFVPCKESMNAKGFARLFVDNVFKLHGLPKDMVSDRGPHFYNTFWHHVQKLLGMRGSLSSSYHPQSDGQTERYNRVLEEMLRHYISPTQADWPDYLSLAEFAVNNSWQESIKSTPFLVNTGQSPITPMLHSLPDKGRCPEGLSYATWWQEAVAKAKLCMQAAQQRQAAYANQDRREVHYKVGQMVLLSTKNMRLKPGKARKLLPRFVGPFKVLGLVGQVAVNLQLPASMARLHPVFHVSLIKPYTGTDVGFMPPPVEWLDEEPVYYVERLLDHRHVHAGKAKEYLVQWEGYDADHNTWEPRSNLVGCDKILAEYNAAHNLK
ncbi:hypothetical protein QJQ45_015424, partial [Haematococcus lacustris]